MESSIKFGVLALCALLTAYSYAGADLNKVVHIAERNGYSQVTLTGHAWQSCGRIDLFSEGFSAMTQEGKQVDGAVCYGPLKEARVQLNS